MWSPESVAQLAGRRVVLAAYCTWFAFRQSHVLTVHLSKDQCLIITVRRVSPKTLRGLCIYACYDNIGRLFCPLSSNLSPGDRRPSAFAPHRDLGELTTRVTRLSSPRNWQYNIIVSSNTDRKTKLPAGSRCRNKERYVIHYAYWRNTWISPSW